jgi:nucleoside-specific outer membrane channel protein Tsx
MKKFILAILPLLLISSHAQAEIFEWHSTNVQLLHGHGFKLTEPTQSTFTLEHANGWAYGDNFFYIDVPLDQKDEWNYELSPRLSLSKIFNQDLSGGVIADVLISGTLERARGFDAYLIGGALDFNVPGFNYFQTNWYSRNNPDVAGTGWQTTWVWSRPFEIAGQKLTFDGYFDYAEYEEGDKNFFTQPQLLLDIGDTFNFAEEGKVQAGLEWRYWHNKYGIEGVTESAPQAMVKLTF